MTAESQRDSRRQRKIGGYSQWLIVALIGLVVLSLAAAQAPARIKLLGLFSIGYGLIAGLGLGALAASLGLRGRLGFTFVAFALIVAGQVGVALESHRLWASREWEAFEKSPTGRLAENSLKNTLAPDEFKATMQDVIDRQRDELTMLNYLARRVSPLGAWPQPWPILFWVCECATASAAGCWVFRAQTARTKAG